MMELVQLGRELPDCQATTNGVKRWGQAVIRIGDGGREVVQYDF